jgi:hypothetical protein
MINSSKAKRGKGRGWEINSEIKSEINSEIHMKEVFYPIILLYI